MFPNGNLKMQFKALKNKLFVKLDWENLIRFVGARVNFILCILSHGPNFLDFNDCLLLFATFYVSLGAPGAGAEDGALWEN